ncbi:MAG: hypothetical protein J5379_07760 [Clostridiales bacterium]|nr:hypothetical protein [Clostridiales bacterium]
MKKKILAVIMACSFVFSMTACKGDSEKDSSKKKKAGTKTEEKETEPEESGTSNTEESSGAETVPPTETETTAETTTARPALCEVSGDYVVFGHYEQDGNPDNGPEPIEWIVLSDEDGKLLLMSRYILDGVPYHTDYTDVTWETCALRAFLNDDFYNTAFDADEQSRILTTTVSNPDNARMGTPGGNDTEDKVFLLSMEEVEKYFTFTEWDDESMHGNCQALMTDATPYAKSKGVASIAVSDIIYYGSPDNDFQGLNTCGYTDDIIGQTYAPWWLRSPGIYGNTASMVTYIGHAGWDSFDRVIDDDEGVRPVIYITK